RPYNPSTMSSNIVSKFKLGETIQVPTNQ
nr:3B protein [Crohivirus A]